MGAFFKDVEEYHEAEAATASGMWGGLLLAGWSILCIFKLFTGENGRVFQLLEPFTQFMFIATSVGGLAIALLAAWRFRMHQGLITGSIALIVFLAGLAWHHMNGAWFGLIWYALFLGIALSLINGLRGAVALRNMTPENVSEAFE